MPIALNNNCRIYWRGDGDPSLPGLVLGNSLGTDVTLWDPILTELMEHFYVVRFDMRGHGGSDAPQGDYTLNSLVDDVQAVITAAGLTKYAYAGISLGGMVGMELAARNPSGLSHVVLSNTAFEFPAGIWGTRIQAVNDGSMAAIIDAVLGRFFTDGFVAANSIELRRVKNIVLMQAAHGYNGCCAAIRDMDVAERLTLIKVPALVVVGEFDTSTPPSRGADIVAKVSGAKLVNLPSAHIPTTEIPGAYAKALLSFLSN
jgi:3-oxoadipate enol-lactonase